MSSLFQLVRAAEAADNEGVAGGEDLQEQLDTAITVADETAEIQQDDNEIGTEVTAIADAVEEGEALEEHAEVVADAIEGGEGLTPEHAETLSIAVESIRNRLGMGGFDRLVPASESFGNVDSRLYSTKLVGEGIKETIQNIWKAIKSMAARVWERIKLFVAKILGSTKMLVSQVASLKERARKMPTSAKPKEKNIKSSGLAKDIGVKTKADAKTFAQIYENTVLLSDFGAMITSESKEVIGAVSSLAAGEINEASVKKFNDTKSSASKKISSKLNSLFADAEATFTQPELNAVVKTRKPAKNSKKTLSQYGPFVGSTVLTFETEERAGGIIDHNLSFGAAPGKGATEVKALELGEIQTILTDVEKLTASINDTKRTQSDYDAIMKGMQKTADTIISSAEKILDKTGSSTETRTGLTSMKNSVNETIQTMQMIGARSPALMLRLARAGINYASLSLSNLR